MVKKDKREKNKHKQTEKKQAPNLGQDEAQQQQRSGAALAQMGERTDEADQRKPQSK